MSTTLDPVPAGIDAACCSRLGVFEILVECHENIRERMDVLEDVGRDLLTREQFSDRHLALLGDVLAFLDVVVPIHTADEEETLFPELCRISPAASARYSALDSIQLEHQGHGVQELRLKVAIVQRHARAAGRLALEIASEYRYHLRKEEEILFPWAMEVLEDATVLEQLAEEMRARRHLGGTLAK